MKETIRWVKFIIKYLIHNLRKIICLFIKYIVLIFFFFLIFIYGDFHDAVSLSNLMILATTEFDFSHRYIILAIAKFYFSDDKIILAIAGFDMAKLF